MRVRHSTDTVAGLALVLATLISLLVSGLATSAAETSPEYQVKAVFLFNFAQFVEWPPQSFEDAAAPFIIGVLVSYAGDFTAGLQFLVACCIITSLAMIPLMRKY